MKKISALLFIAAMLTYSNLFAYPFLEVEGFVNPFPSGVVISDNGNGTSTISRIDYWFTVTTADDGAKMNSLSLEFEGDVFASIGSIFGIDPNDWTTLTRISLSGNEYQINSAGTVLGAGEKLSFSMLNVIIYNEALTNSSLWQEGQIWGQSWAARDTYGGGDGGSTAPVPEPATIFLLGSGLLGVGIFLRKKVKPKHE